MKSPKKKPPKKSLTGTFVNYTGNECIILSQLNGYYQCRITYATTSTVGVEFTADPGIFTRDWKPKE